MTLPAIRVPCSEFWFSSAVETGFAYATTQSVLRPSTQYPRHVEIGGVFESAEIAGRPAVHINVVGAAHGVEPNEHLPVDPFERQLEVGAVDRRPGPVAPLLGHACDSPLRHVDRGHRNRSESQLDGRRVSLDFPLPVLSCCM